MMNVPYRKVLDENGVITNPIKGKLITEFPNRSIRNKKTLRTFNNKGRSTVLLANYGKGVSKFKVFLQRLKDRTIVHYK